ncbi:hypothetical protein [Heyndrickxia ginsengihumi]|uniref:hypothetical protein n=1 Tax=Heyndrickxia ginsengihumi TaxID=363870 RepID=UPI003D1F5E8F
MEQFEPGKTISFRLPSDTPIHVCKYLTERKSILGRKFSSEIAPLFVDAVSQKSQGHTKENEITISLPEGLTPQQKDWLIHPYTRSLITQMLYQVIKNPGKGFNFESKKQIEEYAYFKTNPTIQQFTEKTFLNFEEDDD